MLKRNNFIIIYYIVGVLFLLILWIIGNYYFPNKIPSVLKVLIALIEKDNIYKNFYNLIATCFNAFWGLLISFLFSFIITIIINYIYNFRFIITPFTIFLKATPVVALVPLFQILLSSEYCYIASSFVISFFPLYISGIEGLDRVPKRLIKLAKIYNANKWDQFWLFKKGYVFESMTCALQISGPLSVIGAIVGEYVVGGSGYSLGIFIVSNSSSATSVLSKFVAIILSLFAGMLFYMVGYLIHRYYEKRFRINL